MVALSGNAYLFAMLLYLALRLIFTDTLWWLALITSFTIYLFLPLIFFIPLAVFVKNWRLSLRLLLLLLLAVMWFGPFFQARSVPQVEGQQIRVMTFNMWDNNWPDNDNGQQFRDFEAWLEAQNVDVAVFQEVPADYEENGIAALQDRYPHQSPGDRMIISRYPIVESELIFDRWGRFVLEIDDRLVTVYNVHLRYPLYLDPPRINLPLLSLLSRYDEVPRNQQIVELLELIQEEPYPFILAGDFNLSQHSIKYGALAVELDDAFRMTESGLGVTWPVASSPPYNIPLLRLDYVWYSNGLHAVDTEIGPRLGSDHLPVIATLVLPPEPDNLLIPPSADDIE